MVGAFVVARRDGAVLLKPVEEPLDPVALPIRVTVECRLGRLIAAAGDNRSNAPFTQVAPHGAAAVALIPGDAVGPDAGSPPSGTLHGTALQEGRHGELLVALPAG